MASDGLYVCLCEIKSLKGPTRPSCSHTRQEGQWWGCRQAAGYQTTLAFLKPVGRTGSSQYGFVMDFFTFFFLLLLSFFFLSFFLLQEHSLSWGRNETLIFLLTGLCTSGNYQRNRCIIDVVGKQEGDFRLKMSPLSWSSLWGWWPHSFHLGTRPVLLNSYSTSLFFKHSQAELFRWISLRVRCSVMHSLPAEGPPGPVPYLLWAMPGWCSCDQKRLEGCGRRWLSW